MASSMIEMKLKYTLIDSGTTCRFISEYLFFVTSALHFWIYTSKVNVYSQKQGDLVKQYPTMMLATETSLQLKAIG